MKVLFRKHKDNSIVAIMPEMTGTGNPYTCIAYVRVGQHHSVFPDIVIRNTKLAKPDEYKDLREELEKIYGSEFQVISKLNRSFLAERKRQLGITKQYVDIKMRDYIEERRKLNEQ